MGIHLRATECQLPYEITECYLPPDRWTRPALTPAKAAKQTGIQFTYPGGMEGWV